MILLHTKQKIQKVYDDKGYAGEPNHAFLSLNHIGAGIMCKHSITAKRSEFYTHRNKTISEIRYLVEKYLGISHLHSRATRARFASIIKNKFEASFRQKAFNVA